MIQRNVRLSTVAVIKKLTTVGHLSGQMIQHSTQPESRPPIIDHAMATGLRSRSASHVKGFLSSNCSASPRRQRLLPRTESFHRSRQLTDGPWFSRFLHRRFSSQAAAARQTPDHASVIAKLRQNSAKKNAARRVKPKYGP